MGTTPMEIRQTRFLPMEPAAIVYDNRIIMLCRNGYNPKGNATWASSLFVLAATEEGVPTEGHFPFHPKRTNIGVPSRSGVRSATLFHDTNSIIYNPKTEEIEALVTNRVTNFPSQPECHSDNIISTGHVIQAMTVSIWSIKPSDLFDGRLIEKVIVSIGHLEVNSCLGAPVLVLADQEVMMGCIWEHLW